MAKKKTNAKLKSFKAAALELNEVVGIEPPIETEGVTLEELASKIKEAATLLYEDDEFSKGTEKVIAYVTKEAAEGEEEPEEEQEEPEVSEEPEEEDEVEDEVEDAEVIEEEEETPAEEPETLDKDELLIQVEKAPNRKALLKIAMGEDFFDALDDEMPNLKTEEKLRAAMLGLFEEGGKAKPKKKSKAKKKAPKKKAKKEIAKKPPKKKGAKSLMQQCRDYLEDLIEEGGHTREELVEMAAEAIPGLKENSIQAVITNSKNPKYNKLSKLVVKAEDGTLEFEG